MKLKFLILIILMNCISLKAQEKNVFDVARSGTVAEMQDLMKKNPEIINTPNEMGFSPLILACYRGNVAVAEFLIDNVKDVNYKSPEGTALAGLCIRYNKELVQALLLKKADPNIADSSGTTPLIWAVKSGNEELVRLLLEHGAKKDLADQLGITPFEYAVQTQRHNIINLLKTN
ncbi:MAG: ankyrin repeat domain-containing protein [Kaistella sp.]|nr:ankyrin repeat domain-containing protein [Kaistella sp.]